MFYFCNYQQFILENWLFFSSTECKFKIFKMKIESSGDKGHVLVKCFAPVHIWQKYKKDD